MKKLRTLLGACVAFAGLVLSAMPLRAQINWPAGIYSPNTLAEMNNNRWGSYTLPNDTKLWVNIWAPWNAAGTRYDSAGWRMPMRMWTRIFDTTKRHWHVEYDVIGEMPTGSPYRHATAKYSWVKAYPHVQYAPPDLYAWQGSTKAFQSEWYLGAESSDWANNRFNAIWEIRLARRDSAGAVIPGSDYIIQLEVMQANYGNPAPATVSLSGYNWTPGLFYTFGEVPVHKFILSGAGVTQNASRTVSLDVFPFLQYTANRPNDFPRASWNAKVDVINAGVEVCLGTNSKVWTGRYWASSWNR